MRSPELPRSIARAVENFIIARVRKGQPFMDITSVHHLARSQAKALLAGLENSLPQIQESKDRFDFFTIPPELRNRIYELVVVAPPPKHSKGKTQTICIDVRDKDTMVFQDEFFGQNSPAQPSITKVCRQTREESLPIYYGLNRFQSFCPSRIPNSNPESWELEDDEDSGAEEWVRCIGSKNAALIKHLMFVYYSSDKHLLVPSHHQISAVQEHFKALQIELPQATKHLTLQGSAETWLATNNRA